MFARTQLPDQVRSLAHRLSDESLELLPEYNARLAVLTKLKYLDDNGTVLLKGRVACEVPHVCIVLCGIEGCCCRSTRVMMRGRSL